MKSLFEMTIRELQVRRDKEMELDLMCEPRYKRRRIEHKKKAKQLLAEIWTRRSDCRIEQHA